MIIRKDREGLEPLRFATDFEVAWAAGVYEGEGSCTPNGHGKRSFTVAVSQKDPELLYRLRDLFGGSVTFYPASGGGLVNRSHEFEIHAWRLHGDRARVFLSAVYPYLTSRRKAQIDRTTASRFIAFAGNIPHSDVIPYLHGKLDEWKSTHHAAAKRNRKEYQQRFYDERKSDPAFMEKRRQMTAAWRINKKKNEKITAE